MRKTLKDIVKIYTTLLKKNKKSVILMISMVFILACINIYQPIILANLIDYVVNGDWEKIKLNLLIFVFVYLMITILKNISDLIKQNLINRTTLNLREKVNESIINLSYDVMSEKSNGEIMTWMTLDIDNIARFLIEKISIVLELIQFIVLAILLFSLNYKLAFIIILNFPIGMIVFIKFGQVLAKYENKSRSIYDKYTSFIQEICLGFNVINILQASENIKSKFKMIVNDFYYNRRKMNVVNAKANILGELVNGILYTILMSIACYEIFSGNLSIGIFVAFNSYASSFNNSLFSITQINKDIQEVAVSINRLKTFIFSEESSNCELDENSTIEFKEKITFKDVTFSYANNLPNIFKNMSFDIQINKINGIIGKNGVGKTTILNLLMKLNSGYSGEILFGDTELRSINKDRLYKYVTYIPQEPFLFTGTVKENLLLANDGATQEEIEEVCNLSNIKNVIENLENKYDTELGVDGIQLSGGQKQRLTVARGLLRNSEIFLFDEITSSADDDSENEIINTMKELIKIGKTVIAVSHKKGMIENCENIIEIN